MGILVKEKWRSTFEVLFTAIDIGPKFNFIAALEVADTETIAAVGFV